MSGMSADDKEKEKIDAAAILDVRSDPFLKKNLYINPSKIDKDSKGLTAQEHIKLVQGFRQLMTFLKHHQHSKVIKEVKAHYDNKLKKEEHNTKKVACDLNAYKISNKQLLATVSDLKRKVKDLEQEAKGLKETLSDQSSILAQINLLSAKPDDDLEDHIYNTDNNDNFDDLVDQLLDLDDIDNNNNNDKQQKRKKPKLR